MGALARPRLERGIVNENEIIDAVCVHLAARGCQVVNRCSTIERGIDIVGQREGVDYFIEAKGGTSSRQGSARHGKPYNQSQVFDLVAKGFYTIACLRGAKGDEAAVGLAFPDTPLFRKYVARVSRAAAALNVSFYWVRPDKTVTEEHQRKAEH